MWDSALAWAENEANTATTCASKKDCDWFFDGYALLAEYDDAATSGSRVFQADGTNQESAWFCAQIWDEELDTPAATTYKCGRLSSDSDQNNVNQSGLAAADFATFDEDFGTDTLPPYGWLNNSDVTTTATGFNDFFGRTDTDLSTSGGVSRLTYTFFMSDAGKIDLTYRWEPEQIVGGYLCIGEPTVNSNPADCFGGSYTLSGALGSLTAGMTIVIGLAVTMF